MIEVINNPGVHQWNDICIRSNIACASFDENVAAIINSVEREGDRALFDYTRRWDGVELDCLQVSTEEIDDVVISKELMKAIDLAKRNITKFHSGQIGQEPVIETLPGVRCWRKSLPIERVGLYIPGGSAPLFSTVLMLGIPAKLAGCSEIILCSPPNPSGKLHSAILYAAKISGITSIYKVGGAQAIAAMSCGTETIPKVDKIFGPGNPYVTRAKQLVQQSGTAIDLPAGPSELLIIADESSQPSYVAADLLSQAEHGPDSQVILISNSRTVIDRTLVALSNQLCQLPRREIAAKALANSKAIYFSNLEDGMAFSNFYAPEHLILATVNYTDLAGLIRNAGSVFLGNYSCESAGDYASGTNHTLPTNGYARSYSGVSMDSFVKKVTFQEISEVGLRKIGPAIEVMAEAEDLFAHKQAVTLRLNDLP